MQKQLLFLITSLVIISANIEVVAQDSSLYVPDELYVKIKSNQALLITDGEGLISISSTPFLSNIFTGNSIVSVASPFHFTKSDTLRRIYIVKVKKPESIDLILQEIKKDLSVEYVERIPLNYNSDIPNDPNLPFDITEWNNIKMVEVWNTYSFKNSFKPVIAIVDDAIDINHEDLAGILPGYDVADNDNDPRPGSYYQTHGTHVSGIAGAATNNGIGIASISNNQVLLMPIKAAYNNAPERVLNKPLEGVVWAADHGANIINCSWGSTRSSQTDQNIINYALNKGIIVVAAAGNENSNVPRYPAAYSGVISVANITSNFTKQTSRVDKGSNFGSWVSISAPGTFINSTYPNNFYSSETGTSMSSPMVAGFLGLLKSIKPSLTNTEVINLMKSTATNIDAFNPSYVGQLGSGLINVFDAVKTLCPPIHNFSIFNGDPDQSVCVGFTSEVSIPSDLYQGAEYSFDLLRVNNNSTQVISNDRFFMLEESGTYKYRISKNNCYLETDEVNVTVNPTPEPPTLTYNKPKALCRNESIEVTATCPINCVVYWSGGIRYTSSSNIDTKTLVNNFRGVQLEVYCRTANYDCTSDVKIDRIFERSTPEIPSQNFLKCPTEFISKQSFPISGLGSRVNHLIELKDENFLLASDPEIGNSTPDYNITKVDKTGARIITRTYGSSGDDKLKLIHESSDGSLLLVGESNSNQGGHKSQDSRGGYDIWLVNVDEYGFVDWDETIGGSGNEKISDILRTPDEGYLLIGSSTSSKSGDINSDASSRGGNQNLLLIKIDKYLTKEWDNLYWNGLVNGDYAKGIISSDGFIYVSSNTTDDINYSNTDFWLLKLDLEGNIIFNKRFNRGSYDSPRSIVQLKDNLFILTGRTGSISGNNKVWNLGVDNNGNVIFDRTTSVGSDFRGEHNMVSNSGDLLVVGNYPESGGSYLLKYDKNSLNLKDYEYFSQAVPHSGSGNGLINGKGKIFFVGYRYPNYYLNSTTECELMNETACVDGSAIVLRAKGCSNGFFEWADQTNSYLGIKDNPSSNLNYQVRCNSFGCLSEYNQPKSLSIVPYFNWVDNTIDGNLHKAVNELISVKQLSTSGPTTYNAGGSITLYEGFSTSLGQTFKAEIKGCVDN